MISIYPKSMKKLVCLLLMFWLPLSMATAQAMSTKMMLKNQTGFGHTNISHSSESCHDNSNQDGGPESKSHKCSACSSCVLASTAANFNSLPAAFISLNKSAKHQAFQPKFVSIQLETLIKPPILN